MIEASVYYKANVDCGYHAVRWIYDNGNGVIKGFDSNRNAVNAAAKDNRLMYHDVLRVYGQSGKLKKTEYAATVRRIKTDDLITKLKIAERRLASYETYCEEYRVQNRDLSSNLKDLEAKLSSIETESDDAIRTIWKQRLVAESANHTLKRQNVRLQTTLDKIFDVVYNCKGHK